MGRWDKPLSSANEQVRKTAPAPDYSMSRRATNPALVIHPVLCADLLTRGQMPMTHFPVAFLRVSFASFWHCWFSTCQKKKKKKGHSFAVKQTTLPAQCFLTTQTHAGFRVRGFPSEVGSSLFKGEEARCVATMDGSSRLICA